MGRRRGPRKKSNGGPNWYACLTVPKELQRKAGKRELWQSLGTSNYSLAVKRYGTAIEALEGQLRALLEDIPLAQRVEANKGAVVTWGEQVERHGKWEWVETSTTDPEFVAEAITDGREDKEVIPAGIECPEEQRTHVADMGGAEIRLCKCESQQKRTASFKCRTV